MTTIEWAEPPEFSTDEPEDEWLDAWRWQDLAEDWGVQLDMTDNGFHWTRQELEEVVRLTNLSSSLTETITDENINRLAKMAGLD